VEVALVHEVGDSEGIPSVQTRWEEEIRTEAVATRYWDGLAKCRTFHADLDFLFSVSRRQLPTAVDSQGRMDGSIWQYNLEWVRDQAHVSEALVRLGDYERARTVLARLLDEFVSSEGDTVDSGRRRPAADVELDQNGELLVALGTYVDWTGDLELVTARWEKVRALATFPLHRRFRHPSALLHNQREYWERHAGLGIEDGFELASQFFVALGLETAARLADMGGRTKDRDDWREAAAELKGAMLEDPHFRLIEDGHLIKRRGLDGRWQRRIRTPSVPGLPDSLPLLQEAHHFLDPDTSTVLPIAHGFIDPTGALAQGTLSYVDELWNQRWKTGGYGR
jgi:GH15 family glucan-1,4-alpha-glucosidase